MLVQAGHEGIAAGEIARRLDVPPNTLSSNLTILTNADLVENRRDGRSLIYSARYENMANLLEYLLEDCCDGNPKICARMGDMVLRGRCVKEGTA
ncbi:DNA-binding transcriptional ArsR family regulator [Sphingomonas sp. UYEF23]